ARAAADTPHTENAARAARYSFLRQIAAKTNSTAIALGHTRDDQVETLLLHLLRGSGSRGLAAMRRREGDLARPLLDISRKDIEAYLSRLHLVPRRDPSNDDPRFTRNRLRQQVLPAIDAFDPAARELLARTADILSEEDRFLDDAIARLAADLVQLPLVVATRRPGDRMQPLGLQQAKRLQDILVDAHVPRHLRDTLPVISDREEIVWIPGVTVAESKRVTTATHRQLHLEIESR